MFSEFENYKKIKKPVHHQFCRWCRSWAPWWLSIGATCWPGIFQLALQLRLVFLNRIEEINHTTKDKFIQFSIFFHFQIFFENFYFWKFSIWKFFKKLENYRLASLNFLVVHFGSILRAYSPVLFLFRRFAFSFWRLFSSWTRSAAEAHLYRAKLLFNLFQIFYGSFKSYKSFKSSFLSFKYVLNFWKLRKDLLSFETQSNQPVDLPCGNGRARIFRQMSWNPVKSTSAPRLAGSTSISWSLAPETSELTDSPSDSKSPSLLFGTTFFIKIKKIPQRTITGIMTIIFLTALS